MILLRSALFNVVFFGMTAILTLPGLVIRAVAPHRVIDLARLWAACVIGLARVICGIRLSVTGQENLGQGAVVIASRHQSAFDTLVWLTLVPDCCYVLKQELLRIPLFGPLIRSTGMIAIDRAGGAATIRQLMREGERAAQEGRQIIIFPEGTRGDAGRMLPLQPGVAALASRTRLRVVPVLTDSGLCWGRRSFQKRPGTIRIDIRPPLPDGLRREALMDRLTAELQASPSTVKVCG